MNFTEFAINNVKRNIKSYLGYFFSILISSSLLFSFNMFVNHPDLDISLFDDYLILTMKVTTIIIYVFLFLFVFYSASVFLKSRNKEFGILYTIGISKRQVKKMIFIENLIMNILASALGVLIGVIFAKMVLVFISSLIGIEQLEFYIPIKSMGVIILYFTLLSVLTSYFIYFVVREDKVIKLLKGTQTPKPEPKSSPILAILCVLLLVVAYYRAVTVTELELVNRIVPVTSMVIVGTYLLFSQLSVFVIKKVKENKRFYKKNINMLCIANLHYKIKDNTRMFFLVTITSAVAFTAIGSVYSYWKDQINQVEIAYPQAIFYATEREKLNGVEDKYYKDRVGLLESLLQKENIPYDKTEGEMKTVFSNDENEPIKIIKESKYIQLIKEKGLEIVALKYDEAILLSTSSSKKKDNLINIDNKSIKLKDANKSVMPAYYSVYVVKDEIYDSIDSDYIVDEFVAIDTKDYMDTLNVSKYFEDVSKDDIGYKFLSKSIMVDAGKIAYSVLLFLSVFIGLIFFVTSSSFLYNKLYVDCQDDKKKYRNLNKIGLTYKEIKRISTIEIGTLFLFPYIVAVIHSTFALLAFKNALNVDIASSSFLVMGSFFIVLLIYFIIIRRSYINEIKEYLID
ncbi:MAG: FtsX-like permease family protein [Peptostreptococcaceae bacterium]